MGKEGLSIWGIRWVGLGYMALDEDVDEKQC